MLGSLLLGGRAWLSLMRYEARMSWGLLGRSWVEPGSAACRPWPTMVLHIYIPFRVSSLFQEVNSPLTCFDCHHPHVLLCGPWRGVL